MIDLSAIQAEVEAGYINRHRHPALPLAIYNYSNKAQYDNHWTEETKLCRGLILNDKGDVVQRPFPKIFSFEQLNGEMPAEPFEVFEKLDGSLGILYWNGDTPAIATRGSFVSDQAKWATDWLRRFYAHVPFDRSLTYLFEIIFPENRIVVDYGNTRDLFLLAVIDTATGKDVPLPGLNMPTVQRFDGIQDIAKLTATSQSNKEGYVIKFESGLRVKMKFAEYKRLHRLITGINPRHIWEELKAGNPLDALLERVPDEYYKWVKSVEAGLRNQFTAIEDTAREQWRDFETRKESAQYFQTCAYPGVMFRMLDNKDHAEMIWKLIRPEAAAAFRCDGDS
jgi:RNA ligase